ncbi:MAG: phage tail protein [Citrobacter koseri]|nr:phage tail protein [Citrobacter koseri]
MANLPETPQWEEGIYQIEVSDPVLGGPDGISNRQAKQLASRTSYLKQQVEKGGSDLAKHIAAADPHTQYATKASPTFTGTPTAPTPAANDNSKKLVTTEFVARAIAALAGTAPETLDTLKELADALGNDPNFATTVLNKLAEKLAKDQNGADIPDKAAFLQNLGLGDLTKAGVGNGLISTNGYATLPLIIGGEKKVLIIQWGTTSTTGSDGKATATFPVSFTRIPFYVGLTETTGETSGIGSVCVWSKEITSTTTTGFSALASKPWASSFTAGEAANYLAVGF